MYTVFEYVQAMWPLSQVLQQTELLHILETKSREQRANFNLQLSTCLNMALRGSALPAQCRKDIWALNPIAPLYQKLSTSS